MFALRHISFFQNHNEFTGSQGSLRYRILPEEEVLHVWTWYRDVCFAKAEAGDPTDFPLTAQGLDEVRAYLEKQYAARPQADE